MKPDLILIVDFFFYTKKSIFSKKEYQALQFEKGVTNSKIGNINLYELVNLDAIEIDNIQYEITGRVLSDAYKIPTLICYVNPITDSGPLFLPQILILKESVISKIKTSLYEMGFNKKTSSY